MREGLPVIFGGEPKIAEIERLLYGQPMQLPATGGSAQRSLLSGAGSRDCVTPAELLDDMVKTFAAARDAMLVVERAWRDLGERTDQAEAAVQHQATEPDDPFSPEVQAALSAIDEKLSGVADASDKTRWGARLA